MSEGGAVVATSLVMARFVLAAVFLVAGAAKLADRSGSRDALVGFGVPRLLARPLGVLVPVAELVIGCLLLPAVTARWAAVGALALVAVFTTGVVNALLRGREPECHCFGQLHSTRVGPATLMRNAALALIAGFVVVGDPLRGPRVVELAALAATTILAAACWFTFHLLRQYGRVLLRLDALERQLAARDPAPAPLGLPVGLPAPRFAASDLSGNPVGLGDLLAPGFDVMLVFTDPGCAPCNALLPEIAEWQRVHDGELTVVPVSHGDIADNRAASTEHAVQRMLLERDREVADAFLADASPSALLISRDGIVATPVAQGAAAIRALLTEAVAPDVSATVQLGDAAPPLELSDLSGEPVVLPVVPGKDTIVLFWDPACGHCEHMLEDLRSFETDPPSHAPSLLLVSTGDVEANRAQGLSSPIALDPDRAARRAFGMRGTPMAVMVDAEGMIASQPTAGSNAVLTLLTAEGTLNGRQFR
jgi:protein-disulfide isomerase/uncharacterized membrane protein YphA (DoxX/SURF4 family)